MPPMKIGHGYDVHRLIEGRPLILGGVNIPYEYGLLGHSDADCLLHAVMDALLGALGLGDIGRHFPDTAEEYRGIDSCLLCQRVAEMMKAAGYYIGNIDATIIAQKPKLAPYLPEMRRIIASLFSTEEANVNIKATTEEGLGFSGRLEGIASHAVCLLYKEK